MLLCVSCVAVCVSLSGKKLRQQEEPYKYLANGVNAYLKGTLDFSALAICDLQVNL